MYKAVFVDVDGTLADNNKNVSKENMEAIKNAQEKGIQIIICSGRQRVSARKFKELCDISRYIICTNGSEIYDCEKEEILYRSTVETEDCKMLYDFATQNDILLKLNFGPARAITKAEYLGRDEILLEENIDDFLSKNQISQITLCSEDKAKIETAQEIVANSQGVKIVNEYIWNVNNQKLHAMHCGNPNVSKGNAMAGLCKYLRIDLESAVAIGDDMNDVSMIKMAGLGVAMGNAVDEVKDVADIVTGSNEESGVGKLLQKIVEGGI